ncbi:MAG: purine-binding chemotaxis protein CheW [Candidatus Schekmanbacteria bacterium]|nr:purine-binding chemotaxis protein CheW [Candidatus Schekmanbacteria bacterium]
MSQTRQQDRPESRRAELLSERRRGHFRAEGGDVRAPDSGADRKFVTFAVGRHTMAADVAFVREISELLPVAHVPSAPSFVEGVVDLRGTVVPVLDLASRLGLPRNEVDEDTCILFVELGARLLGLVVDRVHHVVSLPAVEVTPPPPEAVGEGVGWLTGVARIGGGLVLLLDLPRVLSARESAAALGCAAAGADLDRGAGAPAGIRPAPHFLGADGSEAYLAPEANTSSAQRSRRPAAAQSVSPDQALGASDEMVIPERA